jgi:hypothetical protein
MRAVVADLESFYDPKNLRGDKKPDGSPDPYSIRSMNTESYCRDKRFEMHGIAIKWDAKTLPQWYDAREFRYIAKETDWTDVFLIHHHAAFDGLVLGHRYGVHPGMFGCTLSMARLLLGNHISVSLDSVRKNFGLPEKITPYSLFEGRHWGELTPQVQQQVAAGAIDEVDSIWKLFGVLAKDLPPEEFEVIDSTIKMFVNPELIGDGRVFAKVWEEEAIRKQALLARLNLTAKDLGSDETFSSLLRARGVEPDTKVTEKGNTKFAFAKDDPFMEELKYDEDPEVRALAEARLGVKSSLLQTRAATLGWMASRGPLCVYLHYAGAHTSRWSGGDDTNFQNWTNGSEINSAVVAPDGWLIGEPDASQIECVAHGQMVLTDHGSKAIQDIQLSDRVWDGTEWVTHEGVVYKGTKQVISYQGLTCTPDHIVYVRSDHGEEKMEMRVAATSSRDLVTANAPAAVCQEALQQSLVRGVQNLRCAGNKIQIQIGARVGDLGRRALTASGLHRGRDRPEKQQRPLRSWEFEAFDAARERQQPVYDFLGTNRAWAVSDARLQADISGMWLRTRPNKSACREGVNRRANHSATPRFPRENDVAQADAEARKVPVYDIVNAGPRHRFTVSGVIVSNCRLLNFCAGQWDKIEEFRSGADPYVGVASKFYGFPVNKKDHPDERQLGKIVELQAGYMSGGNKIRSTVRTKSKGKLILTPAQGVEARDAYRSTHPAVVEYWNEAGRVITRMANFESFAWGPFRIWCDQATGKRRIILPNGIQLVYDTLEFFSNPDDGNRYWRLKTRKGWVKIYSGKMVENIIQALARLVVSQAMIRLKKLGYHCKNTKHDSLWLLIPKDDGRLEEHKAVILREMSRELPWLPGCPLAAEFKGDGPAERILW